MRNIGVFQKYLTRIFRLEIQHLLYQMYYFFSQSLILGYLKMSNAFILSFFSAYNIKLSYIYTCKVISFGYSYILHR